MSDVIKITDHTELGLSKRLQQWKDKPNLEGIISAHIGGFQDIEDTLFDFQDKRLNIDDSEGVQLDLIGDLVGQERLGFEDDFYRILIKARIVINNSEGEPEAIIQATKLLTVATNVHYMNLNFYEIALGTDGAIDLLTIDFLLNNLQRATMGGVRINYLCVYDPDEAFAIDGNNTQTVGLGLGTLADANAGGKLGQCYSIKKKFSLSGSSTTDGGLGTHADPLVGGVLE